LTSPEIDLVRENKLRLDGSEFDEREVLNEIQRLALVYCGYKTHATDEVIFVECLKLAKTHYGYLSALEISQAFESASQNRLGEINLKAYGGTFTAGIFTDVMNAYSERHRRIKAIIGEIITRAEAEILEKARAETKRLQFRADAIDRFHEAVAASMSVLPMWKTWQEIPWHWAEFICKETYLVQVGEELKREIMAEAIAATWEEYTNEATQPVATKEDQERVREAKKILSSFEPLKNSRCIQNYARLRVWHFCTAKAPEWVGQGSK